MAPKGIFNIFGFPFFQNRLTACMLAFRVTILLIILSALNVEGQEQTLPHFPTSDEKARMETYKKDLIHQEHRSIPLVPPGPVRTMAEWEEVQALVITWAGQSAILREIVRHAVKECKVLIITMNPGNVYSSLTDAGIPLDSVQFVTTPFNSIWVRDYGPWTVYKNDTDSLFLVDWIYNRPRLDDDASPLAIAAHLDIPIYEATLDPDDLVHTGGNHLPDGMGTAFSSNLILEENPDKTEAEIDSIAKNYLGVNQYIKFPTLPFDGIHHLDMHMRVIDEETIIFGEYPEGVADGPQINANIEYLTSEFLTPFGNPYKIVRIPMPPENNRYPDNGGDYRTYTNSIFINKTILVPVYEEKYDTTALRIYRENLPGYNVVGINCNAIIPQLGALHCITKLVGTPDPLYIAHARLRDTEVSNQDFQVNAVIRHKSGIEQATLFYRVKGDSIYRDVAMQLLDSSAHIWTGNIPAHGPGTEIQYFIQGIAYSGKMQVRPIVAPEGYFKFRILGEPVNQLPVVSISYPQDGEIFNIDDGGVNVEINAVDVDGDVTQVIIYINGDSLGTAAAVPYSFNWVFPGTGTYDITVVAIDDKGGLTESAPVQVVVEQSTAVDQASDSFLEVFPNPVSDMLWLKHGLTFIDAVVITNSVGQIIPIPQSNAGDVIGFDFSGLNPGVYFLRTSVQDTRRTWKVIKL